VCGQAGRPPGTAEPEDTDVHIRRGRIAALLLALLTLLGLTACANREQAADPQPPAQTSGTAAAFPVEVSVPGGHSLRIERRPERIVSLNPASTEILYAVGAGEQVVAVDDQSNYPENAPRTDLSNLSPNIEAVVGYQPDLVLASNDTNNLVASLNAVQVPVLLLPAAKNLDETYAQILTVGKATGHLQQAEEVVERMRTEIDRIVAATPKPSRELRYYHELDPTLYSATSSTFIGQVYGLFGLTNIADAADTTGSGYPQLSAEHVINANPDLIFLADSKCCQQNAETVAARPGWSSIAAVRNGHVVALDDDIASRWGPRVVDLVRAISQAVTAAGEHA